jgi:hypothetical protein
MLRRATPANLRSDACRKASGSLKILHEAYAKNADARQRLTDSLASAIAANEAIGQCMGRYGGGLLQRACRVFRA